MSLKYIHTRYSRNSLEICVIFHENETKIGTRATQGEMVREPSVETKIQIMNVLEAHLSKVPQLTYLHDMQRTQEKKQKNITKNCGCEMEIVNETAQSEIVRE